MLINRTKVLTVLFASITTGYVIRGSWQGTESLDLKRYEILVTVVRQKNLKQLGVKKVNHKRLLQP